METPNMRVAILRKHLGMNQEDFAEALAIKQSALSMIENGQRDLSEKNIRLICNAYKVNYTWLSEGSGEMFQDDDGDAQAIIDSILTSENTFMRDALIRLARLDEKYWETLQEIVDQLKKD